MNWNTVLELVVLLVGSLVYFTVLGHLDVRGGLRLAIDATMILGFLVGGILVIAWVNGEAAQYASWHGWCVEGDACAFMLQSAEYNTLLLCGIGFFMLGGTKFTWLVVTPFCAKMEELK